MNQKDKGDPAASNDTGVLELLDGAIGETGEISKALEDRRAIVANEDYPLEERLAAYEDIIDSEVGDTTLARGRNLEREVGLRQIYLKFEGGNPSGTQKDRIAFAQAMDAIRRGFEAITLATCGNYGTAVALAASLAGLRCLIHIPYSYHTKRVNEMTDLGAEIELYDANPGGANAGLQMKAYGEIAYELYDELRDAPTVIAVPVSNGTTLAGIYRGFLSLYRRGKTSRMPRIVAGSSYKKNPIVQAYAKNAATCEDLSQERIHETKINEPLINRHSFDGDHALLAIRETKGWAGDASDKGMLSFSRLIREREGLNVLPASTAGFVALIEQHRKEPLPNDRYVVVLTGRLA
jgi:threonine synthase